jgi:Domain of unknown function (DUF4268)
VELGKLTAVDPRTVWQHEAHDFTPWLLGHADALADTLGIDLELTANEHPVGGFALDLIGRDLTNDCVLIVENQLTVTDHLHLGQILTYAAGTDAATIVWIAVSFREEHRQAMDWLNGLAGEEARFFGVEIGAVQIGNSPVAPTFTLRAQPNDWHAQLSAAAKSGAQISAKGQLYRAFWGKFLERVHEERPSWTRAKVPPSDNWMTMPSPIKGAENSFNFPPSQLRTELYIDTGDREANARIFDALQTHKAMIEEQFGEPLQWEPLPNRKASRIAIYAAGDVAQSDAHDDCIDWFIQASTKLREALEPYAPMALAAFNVDPAT